MYMVLFYVGLLIMYSLLINDDDDDRLCAHAKNNKAIVDSRLCSRCASHNEYLLFFISEQN